MTPALRRTAGTIDEAFQLSTDSHLAIPPDLAHFYDDHVAEVVVWDLQDNSNWFRERFVEELTNPQSVLRLNAKGLTEERVLDFIARNRDAAFFDREPVTQWVRALDDADRDIILTFRELIYHVSGARVVNCESALPQEDYLDFDLADLSQGRTRLNDEMVFWKIFVEQAFGALHKRSLPLENLDLLEFADVIAIRQPLLDSGFQQEYDQMARLAISVAREGVPHLVESIERLERMRLRLQSIFANIFDRELPRFLQMKSRSGAGALASTAVSLGLGMVGFVPGVGAIASLASLIKDSVSLWCNVVDLRATPRSLLILAERREEAIRELAARRPSDETPMFDAINLLSSVIRERLTLV